MSAETSHDPNAEKRSKLKALVGKAKEKTVEGAKWAYTAAGPATLKQVGKEALGLLANPPSREKGEVKPRLMEAGRRIGGVALQALIERGIEEVQTRTGVSFETDIPTYDSPSQANPTPEHEGFPTGSPAPTAHVTETMPGHGTPFANVGAPEHPNRPHIPSQQ